MSHFDQFLELLATCTLDFRKRNRTFHYYTFQNTNHGFFNLSTVTSNTHMVSTF